MTPGTKVRTKVSVTEPDMHIPADAVGTVSAVHRLRLFPVEVALDEVSGPTFYRSNELEIIE